MASRETIKGLYRQIERDRVRSVSGQYFIQQSKVREIFTPAKIGLAVAELTYDTHERVGLVKKIQQDGTITFAILVWMGKADSIANFRNHGCLDRQLLLLSETRVQEIALEFGLSFAREYRWQFLPYFFEQDMRDHHRIIKNVGIIFPFVGEIEHIAKGRFGQVSKLTIPTSLQKFIHSTVRAGFPCAY
jgi:hypothetical protein